MICSIRRKSLNLNEYPSMYIFREWKRFMNDEMMCEILEKESVMNLKNNIQDNKKLFFIQDIDRNSVFLIQV